MPFQGIDRNHEPLCHASFSCNSTVQDLINRLAFTSNPTYPFKDDRLLHHTSQRTPLLDLSRKNKNENKNKNKNKNKKTTTTRTTTTTTTTATTTTKTTTT